METKYTKQDNKTLLKATPISLDIEALYINKTNKEHMVEKAKKNLAQFEEELAEIEKDIAEAEKLGITKEVIEVE